MKVSKSVIIFGIVILLLAAYIHFFTGKKKTPGTAAPAPPVSAASQKTQPGQTVPVTTSLTMQSPSGITAGVNNPFDAVSSSGKPDFSTIKGAWTRNPFLLPQFKKNSKAPETPPLRLSAIFQRGNDKLAIIDHEIVRVGDTVNGEKVVAIEKGRVVLSYGNGKRVLSLADVDGNTETQEEIQMKGTENKK